MLFKISRTSTWDEKPCNDTKEIIVDRVEIRTLSTPEEFDAKFSAREGEWLSKGVDHKINVQGHIQRTHKNDQKVWTKEFSTLEEIMAFSASYGEIVIGSCMYSGMPELEIYDDYRE